jgi:NAD(P)-dependent dehydrogenase (short-subunit alcohol dehydrogenase family)
MVGPDTEPVVDGTDATTETAGQDDIEIIDAPPGPRVWFITGCSSGIGREIAIAALEAGDRVALTARKPETVAGLVDQFGEQAVALALDVTDRNQITEALAATEAALGPVDVLVNNAGYGYMAAVEEGDDAEVRKLFDTNFFAAVDLIKAVLPSMRERRSGHIINISSMTGLVSNPPNVYYSCTKFALESLTEGLAKEVEPFGIRVSAIEPGAFRTDWATRSMGETDAPIGDYDEHVGVRRELIRAFGDALPGDPRKVGEAAVMLSRHPNPPLRLLLGKDVLAATREKMAAMEASIAEWEAVTVDVDLPPGG